jgi:Ca-activated chloride channel family protein
MTSKGYIFRRVLISLSFVSVPIICGSTAAAQEKNTSTSQTSESRILLTAVDKDQNLVKTLRAGDIRILENGSRQSITGLRQINDRKVSVAILIDTSESQERTLDRQKLAAASFVDSIIRPAQDEATIATFSGTGRVEQQLTGDRDLLQAAIARVKITSPPGGGRVVIGHPPPPNSPAALMGTTALWDAILATCDEVLTQSALDNRRAIILLTDGQDTSSKSKMSQAIENAIKGNVVVYSIGIGDSRYDGVNKNVLRTLSERTGGQAFFPKKEADISAVFLEIGAALRNQYMLSYSRIDGGRDSHKIRVEIVNPALKGVQLFYQQSAPNK